MPPTPGNFLSTRCLKNNTVLQSEKARVYPLDKVTKEDTKFANYFLCMKKSKYLQTYGIILTFQILDKSNTLSGRHVNMDCKLR